MEKNNLLNTGLKLAGIVAILYLISQRAANAIYEGISYTFRNPTLGWELSNPLQLLINIDIDVTNENPIGGQVTDFNGVLYYNNQYIGNVQLQQAFQLPANSTALLQIDAIIPVLNLPTALQNIISAGGAVSIAGVLKIEGVLDTSFINNIAISESLPVTSLLPRTGSVQYMSYQTGLNTIVI